MSELTKDEVDTLDITDLSSAEEVHDAIYSVGETEEEEGKVGEPKMTDPGWHDFVIRHFSDDELDPDGRPLVHGLRRVAHLLLGPILESEPEVVQSPAFVPTAERLTLLQPAVVKYRIKLLMCRLEQGMQAAYPVTFGEVADVYYGNCDPEFARFATATAATRAEARCLRKMLRLRTIAAEESTAVPLQEAAIDGFISPTQLSFINVLCRRCDIDVMKYVNSGKKQYERIQDVPFGTAVKMVEHLSGIQTSGKTPADLKCYNPNWLAE